MSNLQELAHKIAEIGSRQSFVYIPQDDEAVSDDDGRAVANKATELLRDEYQLPQATVRYCVDDKRWKFSGNLERPTRSPGIPTNVTRITGGRS